ncbi:muts domain V-domain-containing protein [Gamsiella multidivaricata]|uniref:muts domain V-domain-containing protein n=1 Tax=Gamsiella multidivaricata TaxID=101098 RepID=UPI00221EF1FF|nr:muts domain V-domain-containing protein [Gamsiella multidivaricata]KAG0369047.1 Mismatch repair protein msh3 [Gamsiella multidivaricata]KAI7818180.1 muts domain V-domain-containing protein [Gamsiella multidivaricata]
MVDRKGPPPQVQKTLLSFFKPKSATPPTSASAPIQSATASPSASLNQNNRHSVQDSTARDNLARQPTSRKKRGGSVKGQGNIVSTSASVAAEDPLFPAGFSDLAEQFALDSTPTSLTPSSTTTKPSNENRTLSRDISGSAYASPNEENSSTRTSLKRRYSHSSEQDDASEEPLDRKRRSRTHKEDVVMDQDHVMEEPEDTPQPLQKQQLVKATTTLGRFTGSKKATKSPYTPLETQFVEIKRQYPDAILCIEVGYKFRFFGEDAEIASRELSIAHFMDHNFYTASIPTHRLDVHVRRLVHAGYKVGVVRQMETAALKSAGDNKSAPFTRKLTNLYTKATFLESLDQDEEQFQGSFVGKGPSSQYLMCICEQPQGGSGADERVKIAILAVQPATGDIVYDEFMDGHFRNELETRLLHIQPAELIVPIEPMSKSTEKLLGYLTGSSHRRTGSINRGQDDIRIERTAGFVKYDQAFKLVSEFYSTSLKEEQVKRQSQDGESMSSKQSQMEALLKTVLGLSRQLIVALSAMITHLTEFGLASVFRLSKYFECFTSRSHMLLNGNTISNLEIYRNQTDWSTQGSLFAILDHTLTGFGRRLLKKWVGKPLVDRKALQERVDAVEEILTLADKNTYLESARGVLKGLMDLEKGVCRIHYGKSSPKEFLAILRTFMRVANAIPAGERSKAHQDFGLNSPMLRRLVGSLSSAAEDSRYFLNGLNESAANRNDKLEMFQEDIIAEKWPEIHEHRDNIVGTEGDLSIHLAAVRKLLREPRLEYSSVSGIDYLIEVKNKDVAKIPKSWVKISGTKQVSRFHTPEALQLIQAKAQHQERLVLACDRAFAAFQQEFSQRYEVFRDLVQNLAYLDCLFSLSVVACLPGYVKPQYVEDEVCERQQTMDRDDHLSTNDGELNSLSRIVSSKTTIEIKNGRHPMVEQMLPSGNFVSNDIHFGNNTATGVDEKALILTGPNMGGKSCYIRQVALLCIMAQIGSYLPAESAKVSLLDAVYTRMGASDNIFGHESTFMVELQETSDILKMATARSLVILDELGRGTSTLDGVAIAYAVLKHVVSHIRATTLFVTHYPSLADVAKEFEEGTIRNYHMGFMASASGSTPGTGASAIHGEEDMARVEEASDNGSGVNLDDMDIVFLYKLVPGVSLKSYGLNVARMAKLPLSLITKARIKSKELETVLERRVESRRHGRMLSRLHEIGECSTEDQACDLVSELCSHPVESTTIT